MPQLNENFLKLEKNYLFINIAKKVKAFTEAHPDADIIRMGIGDVTQPIAKCVVEAMKKGVDEIVECADKINEYNLNHTLSMEVNDNVARIKTLASFLKEG